MINAEHAANLVDVVCVARITHDFGGQVYIDGANIVLSSESVPEPVKVRYMGKPRTTGTLYNEASLPLGPFETK